MSLVTPECVGGRVGEDPIDEFGTAKLPDAVYDFLAERVKG